MATEIKGETLRSLLCTKENWTTGDTQYYTRLSFREDGVGFVSIRHAQSLYIFTNMPLLQMGFFSDGPGYLLICEFDWEILSEPPDATADTIIDTRQKDLEDSLRTRWVEFFISIKIRKCAPREEFGVSDINVPHKELLIERLKEVAFEEEEYINVKLEVGNFPPQYDHSYDAEKKGLTRWGLRLVFQKSPVPSLDKWNEGYLNMAESQHFEAEVNWFSRYLRTPSDGWKFSG